MLTVAQAQQAIDQKIKVICGIETLPLKACPGRILAEDTCSHAEVPGDRISAMDGYALNTEELTRSAGNTLRISGTSWAGRPCRDKHRNGECIRIFTGAVVPDWANAVIIQENVRYTELSISLSNPVAPGEHIREAGSDIHRGQMVLKAGHRISAADIGILASLGICNLAARRRLRVAFFSTGDELRSVYSTLNNGEIYDSNRYSLYAMLRALNIEPEDLGVIRDDPDELHRTLRQASIDNDVIISSGGVSVGDADYIRPALEEAGSIDFWKIAMKPGKPLAFGQIEDSWFFGLPGNPVSVMVTFYQIVKPALLKMMGAAPRKSLRLSAQCTTEIRKNPGRQEFQRGNCSVNDAGILSVIPAKKQQSHHLSVLGNTNCFIILPADCTGVRCGAQVEIELIEAPYSFC